MELIPLLSTIIFLITLITFIIAISSYVIFRVKERRSGKGASTPPPPPAKSTRQPAPPRPQTQPEAPQTTQQSLYMPPPSSQPPLLRPQPVMVPASSPSIVVPAEPKPFMVPATPPLTAPRAPTPQVPAAEPNGGKTIQPKPAPAPVEMDEDSSDLTPAQSAFLRSFSEGDSGRQKPVERPQPEFEQPSQPLAPRRFTIPGAKPAPMQANRGGGSSDTISWK